MNNLLLKAVRAALLTFLPCILFTLAALGTVICQQVVVKTATNPPQKQGAEPLVLTVTVTNKKGDYVTGLEKSNFVVLDDKATQELTYFKGQDEPVSIGILFDASGSMDRPRVRDMLKTLYREALLRFIEQSNKSNEYFLIGFNERPQLLLDWTRDTNAISNTLGKLEPKRFKGNTALYDACYVAVGKLNHSTYPKRAMIVISDGQDNQSQYTFKELRQLLRESNVLLYAVGINNTTDQDMISLQGQSVLNELALVTGGSGLFPAKSSHVRHAFDLLAAELRHQYELGFNLANNPEMRDWHRIKIKLAIPSNSLPDLQHLSVRSREGYYPKVGLH